MSKSSPPVTNSKTMYIFVLLAITCSKKTSQSHKKDINNYNQELDALIFDCRYVETIRSNKHKNTRNEGMTRYFKQNTKKSSDLIHADDIRVSNKFHGWNFTLNLQREQGIYLLKERERERENCISAFSAMPRHKNEVMTGLLGGAP